MTYVACYNILFAEVTELARELEFTIIDMQNLFADDPAEPPLFCDYVHLYRLGHQRIADELARRIAVSE